MKWHNENELRETWLNSIITAPLWLSLGAFNLAIEQINLRLSGGKKGKERKRWKRAADIVYRRLRVVVAVASGSAPSLPLSSATLPVCMSSSYQLCLPLPTGSIAIEKINRDGQWQPEKQPEKAKKEKSFAAI